MKTELFTLRITPESKHMLRVIKSAQKISMARIIERAIEHDTAAIAHLKKLVEVFPLQDQWLESEWPEWSAAKKFLKTMEET